MGLYKLIFAQKDSGINNVVVTASTLNGHPESTHNCEKARIEEVLIHN